MFSHGLLCNRIRREPSESWYPSLPMLLHPRTFLQWLTCILSSGPHKLPPISFGDISSGLTLTAVSSASSPGDLVSFGEPV